MRRSEELIWTSLPVRVTEKRVSVPCRRKYSNDDETRQEGNVYYSTVLSVSGSSGEVRIYVFVYLEWKDVYGCIGQK